MMCFTLIEGMTQQRCLQRGAERDKSAVVAGDGLNRESNG